MQFIDEGRYIAWSFTAVIPTLLPELIKDVSTYLRDIDI
jgi:hypothetical protein